MNLIERYIQGTKVAWPAAIILALYPEAVLLGSSQMREAFTITLTMVAFYGLVYYLQERSWAGLGWVLASLLLFVPLSPPFAGLLIVALALTLVSRSFAQHSENFGQRRLWLLLFILVLLAIAGSWIVLKQFTPPGMNNPFTMIGWYIRKSANLQAYLTEHASGWMQKIFDSTPEWTHIPLMVSYGVFRPFLPAAIVAGSQSLIWPWITVWRSLGWTFFLAFLIYAPWLAIVKRKNSGLIFALIAIIWVGILIASFRGGADQSDNPRYRAVFAGLQSAVVAWVWVEEKNSGGKRLRRALVAAAIVIIWFLPWYLRRYTGMPWPVEDPFITLGLGTACAGIFWLWDWARLRRRMTLAGHPPDNDEAPPQ